MNFLNKLEITGLNSTTVNNLSRLPIKVGLAISGGGYRSMLISSGFILGMDECGLFDGLSYIAGISGGSWTIMKLLTRDFNVQSLTDWELKDSLLEGIPNFELKDINPVIDLLPHLNKTSGDLRDTESPTKLSKVIGSTKVNVSVNSSNLESNTKISHVSYSKRSTTFLNILKGFIKGMFRHSEDDAYGKIEFYKVISSLDTFRNSLKFYIQLHADIKPKKLQGFSLSLTDYWGRALWRKALTNSSDIHSMSQLWKSSKKLSTSRLPIPIILANCKNDGLKNVVFEFTPFEFGSWNPILRLFVKLEFLGSKISRGIPKKCYNGFDDLGFITATSSSIFNNIISHIFEIISNSSNETVHLINSFLALFGLDAQRKRQYLNTPSDYAIYKPNPFYRFPGTDNCITEAQRLLLVDGGEDGENIPLRPLLQPERKLDIIFVVDSSIGNKNYPTGSILRHIYENIKAEKDSRLFHGIGEHNSPLLMPYIPPAEEFMKLNLLSHPVAFGCSLTSFSLYNRDLTNEHTPPIIIYHANYNNGYHSNRSTFQLSYQSGEVSEMLKKGQLIFTNNNKDGYLKCLGCLIVKRAYDRSMRLHELPSFCHKCYKEYCYN